MEPRHPFFRERAIREYLQKQEKDILPRFLSPYITILTCLLFFLLLLIGLLAWWGEVPLFVTGTGIVRAENGSTASRGQKMMIVLFLPARYAAQIHPGIETQISFEPTGQQFTGRITQIVAKNISSGEARQRYMLNDAAAQAIPRSAVAVILLPVATGAPSLEKGDLVSAQVRVGSQRILSFLLGAQETNGG